MIHSAVSAPSMAKYQAGDYIKFEIRDDATGESEWMSLRVDYSDEAKRVVFGWLDSQPVVFNKSLRLGQHLAVSFDNIRAHKTTQELQ